MAQLKSRASRGYDADTQPNSALTADILNNKTHTRGCLCGVRGMAACPRSLPVQKEAELTSAKAGTCRPFSRESRKSWRSTEMLAHRPTPPRCSSDTQLKQKGTPRSPIYIRQPSPIKKGKKVCTHQAPPPRTHPFIPGDALATTQTLLQLASKTIQHTVYSEIVLEDWERYNI